MDLYTFILYFSGILGTIAIGFFLVRSFVLKKEILELTTKAEEMKTLFRQIQLKINRLQNELGDLEVNPEENVLEGLKGAGIGNILDALQINPDMIMQLIPPKYKIYAPLIKGFIEGMAKQKGGKNGTQDEIGIASQV
jgi:hypothetical protein